MYFYIYQGQVYWGRYQWIRSTLAPVFRNKPAIEGRCYISGPYAFRFEKSEIQGYRKVHVSFKGGVEKTFVLQTSIMYYLRDGEALTQCEPKTSLTLVRNQFRNRLNEYRGKYFLLFHKHARCV